ncbi:MAG: GtrA family protein [Candidatus Moranbacteria bacterium]|nr:GtrA family protein [Candidatus Moranbacteria bacterium]
MENTTGIRITQKDYKYAITISLLIGVLFMPIFKTVIPAAYNDFYLIIIPFFLLTIPLGLRIAFLIGKKIKAVYQIYKFGIIGVSNTEVDLGVLALITLIFSIYFGISSTTSLVGAISFYSLFKAISFIVANISSYFWNKYWTFDQGTKQQTKSEFIQFFAVSVVGFLINVFVASFVFKVVLGSLINLTDGQLGLIGAAFGSIAGLAWNFIGYKLWVFKK